MKKLILIILAIMAMSVPAMAIDECKLMGDYAVQFTQYRDNGKSLSWTLDYIRKNVTYRTDAYMQIAKAVYSGNLNPRQNRTVIENMCRDARGN